ncbi:D-amino acid dehydrogenase [Verticiella sediminum]|uniref:D-amino acid dehydrogenase n=1 Tax=Verticiella sediminum TaxID=1247510 RepID=A0A556AVW6_9BURK|nr:D-amino acid dehydrogenase [Verticiella sediminum]TSH97064.1 D-amino acid dehydrogenase [Verticiella sediminum]
MKVVVLGSGIIGTASAWWLRQDGHEVEVIDRAVGPARETSFANGGQVSVAYAEPWATPQAPWRLLQWLMRDDSPLLFRPQFDWRQWQWGLAFLGECRRSRLEPNIRAMQQLAEYSRRTLQEMRRELGIDYDHLERGILTFYRSSSDFETAQQAASVLRDLGVDRRILSADEVIQTEPALAGQRARIVGGDYTASDESGDVFKFTTALAERGAAQGVRFRYSTQVMRLLAEGGRVYAAETIGPDGRYERVHGDVFVVAAGAFSAQLVRPLGVPCPVYPAKGYSATFRILDAARAPRMSLTDSSRKVVISPLGDRLRVAGTAELSGYDRGLNTVRCEALTRIAQECFGPDVLDLSVPNYWAGLRPATPSSVPLVGRTRIGNLYLNTGHGTLGWTMGPGSGRMLADLVAGRRPEPAFPHLGR